MPSFKACVLELRGVAKQYPTHRAVDGVSLEVPRGCLHALLGPSGCGKTTTLRMIAGFEEPTSGDVLLNGERVNGKRPYERSVSTVFQSYALFPHLTVQENVEFGLRRRGSGDIRRRAAAAIELVQLAGKESRRPAQLSGGEKQRVALARSLVLEPDVLLLDEPLAALDPKLRKQVRLELKELQKRVGITFLIVTHDQEEALSMSDRIAVMNQGRIEQIGTPEEIYLRPATRFVAGFLGAVNWIGTVGVRPESMRMGEAAGGPSRRGTVTGVVFLGNCVQVRLRLESGEEAVVEASREEGRLIPGEPVRVWWRESDEMRI